MTAIRPDLLPTTEELSAIRAVAIGDRPADLIVRGGRVLHVHTGEFLTRDVVISGRHIAAVTPVGRMRADTVIDAADRWVTPTFIDAHLHIEYTMLTPGELARLIVPRGTTTVLCDADAMANVAGMAGMCFCADDKHVKNLSEEGHIDHSVRKVIALGLDPTTAYRMATLQPAMYYRIDHVVGSITPGRLADLQLLPDLADVRPDVVIVGGAVVAAGGVPLFANDDVMPSWTRETIKIDKGFGPNALLLTAVGRTARVQAVEMYDGYFKRGFHVDLPVVAGAVQPDVNHDVLKFTVINRHHGDGPSSIGFVRGFGLTAGALAVSSNCPDVNIVAVGTSDAEIAAAVHALSAGWAVPR